jgi:hypothetical protein
MWKLSWGNDKIIKVITIMALMPTCPSSWSKESERETNNSALGFNIYLFVV